MKKGFLLLLLATMCGGVTSVQAQTVPLAATKTNVADMSTLTVDVEAKKLVRDNRGIEDKKQEPKWMTTVPMDSAFYQLDWRGYNEDCELELSTVIPSDVVSRFVGNKVTEIKVVLPTNCSNPKFWILDASDGSIPPLWMIETEGENKTLGIVTVPCDWTVDKVRNLQVGFTVSFKKGTPYSSIIVPNARDLTYLWRCNASDYDASKVYNYSIMPLKNWTGGYLGLPIYCVTEGEGGFAQNGIEINGVSHSKVELGKTAEFDITLANYGCSPVNNITYECTAGDKVSSGTTGGAIRFLGSANFKATVESSNKAERVPLVVAVKTLNDAPLLEEISAEGSVTSIDPAKSEPRTVVMEEYTGAWCGWCPRGAVAMELLSKEYPDNFIPIAVHSGDVMQEDCFYDLVYQNAAGFPSSSLNRLMNVDPYYGKSNGTPMGVDELMLPIIGSLTEAKVNIADAQYDAATGKVTISTETVFNIDCQIESPSYSLAFVLTEDGVNGKNMSNAERRDYLQTNYFSNNTQYNSDPYLKPYVSKSSYYEDDFNHVARYTENAFGIVGSLPNAFKAGDVLKHTYEMQMPNNVLSAGNCNLVVLLIDNGSKEIINATQKKMNTITAVDATEMTDKWAKVECIDGAVVVQADGAVVSVYTLNGAVVANQTVNGTVTVPLEKSTYIVRVVRDGEIFVKKVVL